MENTTNIEFKPTENQDLLQSAGFWMRLWAYTVDIFIVWCINGIILSPLKFVNDGAPIDIGMWSLAAIISTLVLYGYFILMTKFFNQTLGKMIFGLKVIRKDMQSLKWNDLLFREVIGRFLYRVMSILSLLYIIVAFDPLKQGIHDMIGDTRVVHAKQIVVKQ